MVVPKPDSRSIFFQPKAAAVSYYRMESGGKGEGLVSRFCREEGSGMEGLESDENSGCNKGVLSRFTAMLPPQYPRQGGGYRGGLGSVENQGQGKMGSGLLRQSSSPPELLSDFFSENGYGGVRGIGSYRMNDAGANGDLSPASVRVKNHINFSSSSMGLFSRVSENGTSGAKVGNTGGDNLLFSSGFPYGSWNDPSHFAENYGTSLVIKREPDHDHKIFANSQEGEPGNRPPTLSHHLSLPKSPSEMLAMEKLLQLQDTVPCKIRAKRGCATHPRSIAERVRRTKISERMRKLQELVPNMDKQTNTADMLDLAVDYIKNLQTQYKVLSDSRASCKCSASQGSF